MQYDYNNDLPSRLNVTSSSNIHERRSIVGYNILIIVKNILHFVNQFFITLKSWMINYIASKVDYYAVSNLLNECH